MNEPIPVLTLSGVTRRYTEGDGFLDILRGVNGQLWPGQAVALVAPSGAGKSTLLHIAGLLERPDGGAVAIDGWDASGLDDGARTALRRDRIGFVYQFHHLLPEFTALENVMTPQLIAGLNKAEARERAMELLDYLGLSARADHRPSELSGGEQQRVALARAFIGRPPILLADEPTGNLDTANGRIVLDMLIDMNRREHTTLVLVTHDRELASNADRIITLRDGLIVAGEPRS